MQRLRAGIAGRVIAPGDAEYDAARSLYYTGYDRRPAAIARPVGASDVARVIAAARETGLPLAVRSGGHSIAGHSVVDGGIVLDLSTLDRLEIDPAGRTAWAGAGLTAGEYTAAAAAYGLATGFGDTASVGIGGITLGGGLGFLHRKYGLTVDNLLAAEVVTADGEVVVADAESHPDLFWAIRGGGGNFGVVTRFRYRLHEVGDVVGGVMMLPMTPARLVELVGVLTEAPDEVSGLAGVMFAPPMPFVPAEHHGKLVATVMLVHAGPIAEGERFLARLRALASPIIDAVRPMRYPQIYAGPEPPNPARAALHPFFLDTFDRATADAAVAALERSSARMRVVQIRPLGGAVARVSRDATAFAHRDRRMMAIVAALYEDAGETAAHEAWAAQAAAELRQGEPGAYVGFMGEADEARVREAYPGATWDRLAAIKARYDPANVFRLNQNVPPANGRG
ncbi:MAG TPA: FAD-binding oxidoreductase [Longimicrobiales bacterium]